MLEKQVQASMLKYLKSEGYFTFKTIVNNVAGVPDIYALKNGKSVWIEVKRPGGRRSPVQIYTQEQMEKQGGIIMTVESVEDLDKKLKEIYAKC